MISSQFWRSSPLDSRTVLATVDGRNPDQLIGSYSQGFIHLRWLARFLPSTLSCEVLEGKFGDAMSYKSLGHFAPLP